MVETLWDKITQFVSPEAGQRRRAALDEFGRDIGYYVPPEMRGILGMVAESTPTASIDRASQRAVSMVQPGRTAGQRIGDLGGLLSETAGVVAPAMVAPRAGMTAAQAAQEMFMVPTAMADDAARRFVADEAGALRLYPGDYIGQHSAPSLDVGASLDNPTVMFGGDDIYSPNAMRYFGTGMDDADRESLAAIARAKGKPGRNVTVYRAVPKDAPNEIGAGDWVSTSKAYAKDHGEASLGGRGNYKIVKEIVSAGELATDGNSINEWGWWPSKSRIEYALTEGRVKKSDRAKIEEYLKSLGVAGAAALLGISAADVEQAMAQGQPQGLLAGGPQ